MTWFLFGRFGTPAVIAILSRETLRLDDAAAQAQATVEPMGWWRDMLVGLQGERDWFRAKADELAELMVLPVLQLMGVALNFCLIVVTSRPAFDLPFASLKEAMARIPKRSGTGRRTPPRCARRRRCDHGLRHQPAVNDASRPGVNRLRPVLVLLLLLRRAARATR